MATKMATKEEILESISNMSVMDLVDLISCLLYTSPSPRDYA